MASHLDNDAVQSILADKFAPWVRTVDLNLKETAPRAASFEWSVAARMLRPGQNGAPGVVSGQAIMAAADTASVLTVAVLNGGFRDCTTIDLQTNFLRPLFAGPTSVVVECVGFGRKLVTTRVSLFQGDATKLAATATGSFLYL